MPVSPQPLQLLVRNASTVLRVTGEPGSSAEAALAPLPGGAVGIRGGRIVYVGPESELTREALASAETVVDAGGGMVGPGYVDPHTHLVFGGERAHEFDLRCQGKTYLELAQAGGGIMSTVAATRAAPAEALTAAALPRLKRLLEHGVTTAEVKSGYGLNVPDELKMLRVIRTLSGQQPVELVSTLLCAHAIPAEFKSQRAAYVDLCVREILPAVASAGLASFCDVFVEESAWTLAEAQRILEAARAHGLRPKVHGNQLTEMGACQLAVRMQAASVDHLEEVSADGIAALAGSGVVGVLLPTATLFLRMPRYAPGRSLWDAGIPLALGTNVNPGSAMTENHALTLGLACLGNGLSAAEAYWAATRGGARALGLPLHGQLAVGSPGDVVVFSCSSVEHLPYHLGVNHVRSVIKSGRLVTQRPDLDGCS